MSSSTVLFWDTSPYMWPWTKMWHGSRVLTAACNLVIEIDLSDERPSIPCPVFHEPRAIVFSGVIGAGWHSGAVSALLRAWRPRQTVLVHPWDSPKQYHTLVGKTPRRPPQGEFDLGGAGGVPIHRLQLENLESREQGLWDEDLPGFLVPGHVRGTDARRRRIRNRYQRDLQETTGLPPYVHQLPLLAKQVLAVMAAAPYNRAWTPEEIWGLRQYTRPREPTHTEIAQVLSSYLITFDRGRWRWQDKETYDRLQPWAEGAKEHLPAT